MALGVAPGIAIFSSFNGSGLRAVIAMRLRGPAVGDRIVRDDSHGGALEIRSDAGTFKLVSGGTSWTRDVAGRGAVRVHLPGSAGIGTFRRSRARLVAHRRAVEMNLAAPDLTVGALRRVIGPVDGDAPRASGEIALDRDVARQLRVASGDRISIIYPGGRTRLVRVRGRFHAHAGTTLEIGALVVLPDLGRPDTRVVVADGDSIGWFANLGQTSGGGGGVAYEIGSAGSVIQPLVWIPLAIYQSLFLLLPLVLSAAVLAIGLDRRRREKQLLPLAGAPPQTFTLLAVIRGCLISQALP